MIFLVMNLAAMVFCCWGVMQVDGLERIAFGVLGITFLLTSAMGIWDLFVKGVAYG